jgi:hypothetical protein
VPGIIVECADCGVRAAIVIFAGFREHGAAGTELERQVSEHLRRGRLRLIGPNCLGVMNPLIGGPVMQKLRIAEETKSDLTVKCAKARRSLAGNVPHSMAYWVVSWARCPVLTVNS